MLKVQSKGRYFILIELLFKGLQQTAGRDYSTQHSSWVRDITNPKIYLNTPHKCCLIVISA